MSEISYEVNYIKQAKIEKEHDAQKIDEHYAQNRTHFKGEDGKILVLEEARVSVITELNQKATKDMALRTYIAYKKGKLAAEVEVESIIISHNNNPFNTEILEKIQKLSVLSPFLKPIEIDGEYITFELVNVNPSTIKSFEEAKSLVEPMFITQEKNANLLQLANDSLATFKGTTTDFITNKDALKITELDVTQANEFLLELFNTQKKRGYISLENGNIVLYNILEQKMLTNTNNNQNNSVAKLKSTMFNEGLITNLQNKYKTEIFLEGL